MQRTLTILNGTVSFPARTQMCMPPHVPVPKPGPCKGVKRAAKKAVKKATDTAPKAPRKAAAKKAPPTAAVPRAQGRVAGRDLREEIDYDLLEAQSAPTRGSGGRGEDMRLKMVSRMQGFDARPRLGTKADVDRIVRNGGLELFRGTEDSRKDGTPGAELARRFREDDIFYGSGFFGNGIYAADNFEEARRYSQGVPGGVNRMAIDPGARIVDYDEIQRQMRTDTPPELAHKREQDQRKLMELIGTASTEQEMESAFEEFKRVGSRGRAQNLLTTDTSLYAISKGYDVVKVSAVDTGEGQPYYVILNRSAVTVEDPGRQAS